ncbi:complement factor I-like [Chanodichthys erythropterus]|uniref:complement factor I-like n=1 Tax=Chanodichthys erythropterus TaxID=933992 RepID=UPI00351ED4C4
MRVLVVFIFMCLLFQTATLEEQSEPDAHQHRILQHNVQINDPNLEQKQVMVEKTDSKDKPDPILEKHTDEKTEEQTDAIFDGVTNSDPESDLESQSTKESSKPELESHDVPLATPKPKTAKKTEEPKASKEPAGDSLVIPQCLHQNYTRLSCAKVFCPPWRRCIAGQCVCKMPYKCPRQDYRACTLDGPEYYSMCQAKAISCRSNRPIFSHMSTTCRAEEKVEATLKDSGSYKVVMINSRLGKTFVCGRDWNMAAANVVCQNPLNVARGAAAAAVTKKKFLDKDPEWPTECMSVRCTGSELSLAECTIYNPQPITNNTVAIAKCYNEPKGECKKFLCVNGKCLSKGKPCDGVDDCGDNSDEMCCQSCNKESEAFHCKSDVCIPRHAVRDGIRDCLGGEDELDENVKPVEKNQTDLFSDPVSEIRIIRSSTESQLECGIPNMEYEYKQKDDTTSHSRRKRLVGGEEALPTQIQWQVAIQDEGSIHCGGAYLGGCWVLTAAHCVRPKPKSYRIKFSLWKKHRKQSTTDSIPVKKIIIHHEYDPQTYANDIALVQLEELNLSDKCMQDNPAVRSVCVPWSTQQFQPNDTCTISGWGRDRAGMSQSTLKWANVTIISDCKNYYKDRFLPGMECAGDLEGKVDSCQGDSGGPLVCKDASGVSYVWGIVSWGDKCGQANYPGVYTKVAHYFDWIRFNTGWAAVTKYNQ